MIISRIVLAVYAFCARHRVAMATALCALWVLCIYSLSQVHITNSSAAFLPDNSTSLQTMARGMDLAPFSRLINIDLSYADGRIAPEALAQAADTFLELVPQELAKAASQPMLPDPEKFFALFPSYFSAAMESKLKESITPQAIEQAVANTKASLASFPVPELVPWLRADPLQIHNLFLPLLAQKKAFFPEADKRYGYPVSPDKKHLLLTLRPTGSLHDTDYALLLMSHLEQALAHLAPDVQGKIMGGIRHTAANTRAINKDVQWISILSLLGLGAVYACFVRSWGALWLILTPCFAVTLALSMVNIFYGVLSGLALGFGAAILGIAEDYAVHIHFGLRSNTERQHVLSLLSLPLFQGFLLNASGFAVLLFSSLPAIRQLAAFALCTLFVGLCLALFVLPHCPLFDSPRIAQKEQVFCSARSPRLGLCLCVMACLSALCFGLFHILPVDVSPRNMGAGMKEFQQDALAFSKTWRGHSPALFLLEGKDPDAVLAKARPIYAALQERFPHTSFLALPAFLPEKKVAEENCQRWKRFVATQYQAIQHSFAEAEKRQHLTGSVFEPFFRILKNTVPPVTLASLHELGFSELLAYFIQDFPREGLSQTLLIASQPVDITLLPETMQKELFLLAPERLEQELLQAFTLETRYLPYTFFLCLCLLFLCFKKIEHVLLASLPPLCSLAVILIALYCMQAPLTLAGLAAIPLVFGLAIDHGIMVTHDLAKGIPLNIDRAVIVSSLTACVGMGLLAFAQHPALRSMGQVIFWGLVTEIPASLLLLPLLCRTQEKKT